MQEQASAIARRCVGAPLLFFYETLEGPIAILSNLPSAAARLFIRHSSDLDTRYYWAELSGGLIKIEGPYEHEQFLRAQRVEARFTKPFQLAINL